MTKMTLALEDLREGSWMDSDGDILSIDGNEVRRTYGSGDFHASVDRGWIRNALNYYGPYAKLVEIVEANI